VAELEVTLHTSQPAPSTSQ